ncbi:MAG: 3-isopropylmalate dehydratase [Christensenellales bacterium]|jgi:3-isopropylmalate/(R)-2-methylmalate dehydratase small subunit
MDHRFKGHVHKFGDNINTDIISPPAYLELSTKEAAKYTMLPIAPEFSSKFKPGDIIVAGRNFGSGSSRETSVLTLRELGAKVIVAKNFARIFFRNAINLGVLAVECAQTEKIEDGDEIEVDAMAGTIVNLSKGETYTASKLPDHIVKLVKTGGLVPLLEKGT